MTLHSLRAAAAAVAVGAFSALPAAAATVPLVLGFETATDYTPVGNLYAAYGISFGDDALALVNGPAFTYFSNAPSPLAAMAPVGPGATMNVANGFIDAFSFFYTSAEAVSNAVQVWSGLNGSGTLLANFNLANNAQAGGCSDTAYCHFDRLSAAFAGTAYSVSFGNAALAAAFDDIGLRAVPEPATALLVPLALAALVAQRRRR
jgi:hypothetical protein